MRFLKKYYKILLVLVLAIAYITRSKYLLYLFILGNINAIAVLGINIITGYTGQLHLGQAAFMGIGAYTAAILSTNFGVSFWIGLLAAIIIAAIFGILLGIPTLNLKGGPYLALVTQTFGEVVYLLILNLVFLTGGPYGLGGIKRPVIGPFDFTGLKPYFYFTLVFLIVVFFVCRQIINSRFGRAYMSIRESEDAAQSMGINTKKYKIMAFATAAAIGGVSGVLYGPFMAFLSPDQFRWMPSLMLISMAIVGGLRDIKGGLIGAYVVTLLPELLRVAEQYRMIVYGVMVIFVLLFLPNGLVSLWNNSLAENKEAFIKRINDIKRAGKVKINL